MIVLCMPERRGSRVVEDSGGREALEKRVEHRPDIFSMDPLMTVADGCEAVRTARSLEEFSVPRASDGLVSCPGSGPPRQREPT